MVLTIKEKISIILGSQSLLVFVHYVKIPV